MKVVTKEINLINLSFNLLMSLVTLYVYVICAYVEAAPSVNKRGVNTFLGHKITESASHYLTIKDVNVRKAPRTKSPRVGRFKKGTRLTAVGKAKGTEWVAIKQNGKNMGFIYSKALTAIIDGTLKSPLKGTLKNTGSPTCLYKIDFHSKNRVHGDIQVTSDYLVSIKCEMKSKTAHFSATMFITELPYRDLRSEVYQVNVDLPTIRGVDADIMSVVSLYNRGSNKLKYDSVTIPKMAKKNVALEKQVQSIPQVLNTAVKFAYQVWGPSVWSKVIE